MGYNLDFSAWGDMRRAQADAIRTKGRIEAKSILDKYKTYAKSVSGLADMGSWLYDNWDAIKAQSALEKAAKDNGGAEGLSDPMQILSSTNNLSDNPLRNYKRAQIISGLLGYGA